MQAVESAVRTVVAPAAGVGAGGRSVTIRLDPPQLGSVRVHLRLDAAGAATLTVATSSDVAHGLVRAAVDGLQNRLEQGGLTVDRVNVTRMSPAEPAAETRGGDNESGGRRDGQSSGREQMDDHRRDQQRRDRALRLWRRGDFEAA